MKHSDRKSHWEKIYREKNLNQLSWYQQTPTTSLNFIKKIKLPKTARIIDIGGGDSLFADSLIKLGYKDITVLDISLTSLNKAKKRLGDESKKIRWIHSDIVDFEPYFKYDLWHDRAAFHFLTNENEITKYINIIKEHICPEGYLILGTFSDTGPEKCSGLKVKQYSEVSMSERLNKFFKKIKCISVDHVTPLKIIQNFMFCSFKRLSSV